MAESNKAEIVLSATDRTKAAFDSARRNFDSLKSQAASLPAAFSVISLAITGAFEAINLKVAIDAADELSKLSQKTGISVESLSALKYAGQLADVSIEDLATGIKKLGNNMAAAAGGNKEVAATFDAIGVKATTAGGTLRNTDDVLGDIADRFASYKDGAGKAALATELFGKNGAALIPFLNAGRVGLAALKDEAEKLGVVMGGQLGKDAEAFNDNLTRLAAGAQAAKIALAGDLLPTLIKITNQFVDARIAYGSFLSAVDVVAFDSTNASGIAEASNELSVLRSELAGVQAQAGKGGPTGFGIDFSKAGAGRDPLQIQAEITSLEKRKTFLKLQQSRAALELGEGVTDANPRIRGPALKEAPILKKGGAAGADDALAQLKKILDGRLQAIDQNLKNEQDLLKFNETFVAQVYQTGNTSLATYYTAQDEIRRRGLEEQRQALDDTIKAEQAYQAALPKDKTAERIESQNKVAAARAKIAAAEREFAQANALSQVERPDALASQKRALDVFNAQLDDMVSGARNRSAELAEIADRVAAARRQLVQSGEDDSSVSAKTAVLEAQLRQQREFNLARDEFTRVTDRARDSEEALALVQVSRGTGLLDSERQVTALRQQQLERLGKVLDVTRQIANQNPNNEALQKGLREAELAYLRLQSVADATKQRLDAAADNLGSGIASTLGRAVTEGGKLKDILADIGKQIASTVADEAIVKPLSSSISNLIKGSGGQGAGENLIGKLLGLNGPKSGGDGAALTSSFTTLQTLGVEPATSALQQFTLALQTASGSGGNTTAGAEKGLFGGLFDKLFSGGSSSFKGSATGIGDGFTTDALAGYSGGGFTGGDIGIVHPQEYVLSAPAVRTIGVGNLDRMHSAARAGRGYERGGYVGARPAAAPAAQAPQRAMRPIVINNMWASGTTQATAAQVAVQQGRQVARAVGRGDS